MRVATISAYANGLSSLQRLQAAIDQTQRQISTGRRIQSPSDDPVASLRAIEFRESIGRLEQFDRNAGFARNRLGQEETVMTSVGDALQRVRELALQANNATQSDESRSFIAAEMREQLDYLVQLANQKDGSGRYLFAGNLEGVEPVSRAGNTFSYDGDQGQRLISIGEGRQIADGDPGSDIFFRIRAGNGVFTTTPESGNFGAGVIGETSLVDPGAWDAGTYVLRFVDPDNYEVLDSGGAPVTSGTYQSGDRIGFQGVEISMTGAPAAGDTFIIGPSPFNDMFTTIETLASAISAPVTDDASRAQLTNGVNAGLQNLDQALGSVLDVRTKIGSRLSAIENQIDSNSGLSLAIQQTLAGIEELDYAEALSRLSLQVTTLEAAQQSFVRTQQLSLFNYF